jgi:prepilin-type N-terminal cleavage/methylation domain-containing protein
MIARLRHEDGFTLPELLITLVIGLAVTLAGFTLVDVTMRRSGEVSARIEAVQSGRTAMDTVTRELRSTVCLSQSTNPDEPRLAIVAATPTSITMYTDLRDTSLRAGAPAPAQGTISGPDKRTLTFTDDGKLLETTFKPTALANGVYTFQAAGITRELLTSVEHAKYTADNTDVPFVQYFKYDFDDAARRGVIAEPNVPLIAAGTPAQLDAEQLMAIAKLKITNKANPAIKRRDGSAATVFTNEVFTRNVDANADIDKLSEPCK